MGNPDADSTTGPPVYMAASEPPSYAEAVGERVIASASPADDVPPALLVLENQTIYAASNPAVPLYQVNRSVAHLGPATSAVEFARMEQRSSGTVPRHLYNLRHVHTAVRLLSAARYAEYFAQAVAAPARRLGDLGWRQARGDDGAVLPVNMKGWTERDQPDFVADAPPLFRIQRRRDGSHKWTDTNSDDVAMEYYDSDTNTPRLLVTVSLSRAKLDALVALWCCCLWLKSADQQRAHAAPSKPSIGWRWAR